MSLQIHTLIVGPFETNCYVLRNVEESWVVDPGMGVEPVLRLLRDQHLRPSRIVLTHGHGDHIAGAADVQAAFPDARLCCPAADAAMLGDAVANLSAPFGLAITAGEPDELLRPGESLQMGSTDWHILDTSGHSPGGVSLYCRQEAVVLTGDALFAGGIGRTDMPGGSASRLLGNIREHLLTLPQATRVLPGHGPPSTIGRELRDNPFFCPK